MKTVNKICRTNIDCNPQVDCATLNVAMVKTTDNAVSENWRRFGLWVTEKRQAKGWLQEDAAERAGMHRQQWYRIESGSSTKRSTVVKIAEVLGEDRNEALAIAFGLKSNIEEPAQTVQPAQPDPEDIALLQTELAELTNLFLTLPPDRRADVLAIVHSIHARHKLKRDEAGSKVTTHLKKNQAGPATTEQGFSDTPLTPAEIAKLRANPPQHPDGGKPLSEHERPKSKAEFRTLVRSGRLQIGSEEDLLDTIFGEEEEERT